MEYFRSGNTDVLVATTVIEVGVDVPNASLMIIENAERLGLAQLHQLRGRVGRGSTASACVLMYQGKLSANGRARLAAMRETTDGFEIARRDLELRGPGEFWAPVRRACCNCVSPTCHAMPIYWNRYQHSPLKLKAKRHTW